MAALASRRFDRVRTLREPVNPEGCDWWRTHHYSCTKPESCTCEQWFLAKECSALELTSYREILAAVNQMSPYLRARLKRDLNG